MYKWVVVLCQMNFLGTQIASTTTNGSVIVVSVWMTQTVVMATATATMEVTKTTAEVNWKHARGCEPDLWHKYSYMYKWVVVLCQMNFLGTLTQLQIATLTNGSVIVVSVWITRTGVMATATATMEVTKTTAEVNWKHARGCEPDLWQK